MPSITGLLALVVASSPLAGAPGDLTAVYGWSMACVFGILPFGSGIASRVTPGWDSLPDALDRCAAVLGRTGGHLLGQRLPTAGTAVGGVVGEQPRETVDQCHRNPVRQAAT
jgi:hypothetical protein